MPIICVIKEVEIDIKAQLWLKFGFETFEKF